MNFALHCALRFAVFLSFSCIAVPGLATESLPENPTRPPKTETRTEKRYLDYRPRLFAADALALGMFVAAVAWEDGPQTELAVTGLGIYVLGGPTVHVAHGQPVRALPSLAMRAGFPVLGASLGLLLAATCDDEPSDPNFSDEGGIECVGLALGLAAIGAVGGGVTAIIVDDGFLGKVPIEEPRKAARASVSSQVAVVPLVVPKRQTLGMSLVGTF